MMFFMSMGYQTGIIKVHPRSGPYGLIDVFIIMEQTITFHTINNNINIIFMENIPFVEDI